MPGQEDITPIGTPRHHPSDEKLKQSLQKSDTTLVGSENERSSGDSTVNMNTNTQTFETSELDNIPGWPIPAAHRVTINSQRPSRSSSEVARSWSLRGFHSRPGTAGGDCPAVPQMPAIAVTTDMEIVWDREMQRVLLGREGGIGVGV